MRREGKGDAGERREEARGVKTGAPEDQGKQMGGVGNAPQ
ncbi:Hypothetical protein CAP_7315 [Chondromyces apiculatus DSM 436]|uniref:Uncharacterized protein n=1 Tax=Chondromyces apiculatus DSM 436 TaxID=1192034 RepID=A0A017SZ46_9BACT|nr:Hypothetical protein CAP_7315 [Chondromyces apiculatus DSM 436]